MKRSTILIVILLCSAFSSSAQEIDKLPVITVSGTAEVQIAPDGIDAKRMIPDHEIFGTGQTDIIFG